MSDAPKRIWATCDTPLAQSKSGTWHERPYGTQYIRADLVAELAQAAEDAEYDLLQWLECSKHLEAAGFNMDGTAPTAQRLTVALRAIKEADA